MCHVSVSFQCCPGEIQLDELRYFTWKPPSSAPPCRFNYTQRITLPETNGSPLKIGLPQRNVVFPPSIFRGEHVSFGEGKNQNGHLVV